MWPCAEVCPAVQGIRNAIMAHTNQTLPDPPPQPKIVAYGDVALTQQATLLDSLGDLFPGAGHLFTSAHAHGGVWPRVGPLRH